MKHKPVFGWYPSEGAGVFKVRCSDCGKVLFEMDADKMEDCTSPPPLGISVQETITTKERTG